MLVVDSVIPGGPADGLLEPGDVLVRIQGEVVVHFLPMEALLDDHVGQRVSVEVERGGKLLVRSVMVSPAQQFCLLPCTLQRTEMPKHTILPSLAEADKKVQACSGMVLRCLYRCRTCMQCLPGPSWRWLEASCTA